MTLSVRTDFPGGNGLPLSVDETAGEAVLRFAAEPRNCPEAMWFHFRAAGLAGRGLRCVLANPEQTLGGGDWSRNRPVFRPAGGAWTRSGPAVRVDAPGGRVEWGWEIPPGADEVEFAHCFPYQITDLEATLRELGGVVESAFIGLSQKGRAMTRLATAAPDAGKPAASDAAKPAAPDAGKPAAPDAAKPAAPDSAKPAALLLARNHAGETPGSWVLDGLLRHLAAREELRAGITWWAVPFVDLDDVVEGSYGKDPWPHDCNRSWGNGKRAETIAVAADAARLVRGSSRLLVVDLHAPAHHERTCYVPCRGWDADSPINPIAARFAEAFREAVPADIRSPIAHVTPGRASVSRHAGLGAARWATEVLGRQGVTLEISYQGNQTRDYSIADYRRLGAALAETVASWLAR